MAKKRKKKGGKVDLAAVVENLNTMLKPEEPIELFEEDEDTLAEIKEKVVENDEMELFKDDAFSDEAWAVLIDLGVDRDELPENPYSAEEEEEEEAEDEQEEEEEEAPKKKGKGKGKAKGKAKEEKRSGEDRRKTRPKGAPSPYGMTIELMCEDPDREKEDLLKALKEAGIDVDDNKPAIQTGFGTVRKVVALLRKNKKMK